MLFRLMQVRIVNPWLAFNKSIRYHTVPDCILQYKMDFTHKSIHDYNIIE